MEEHVLKAEVRDVKGKQVKALRRQGKLPAVVYGRHQEPMMILLDARDAGKVLNRLTSSSLVNIDVNDQIIVALVREKQRNFLTSSLLHVDFLAVSATETLRASVTVKVVGESPAVKNMNGILVLNLDELEVECLPKDLPESITIDISGLALIGAAIKVKDVSLPAGVVVMHDDEDIVAVITAQEKEEAEEAGVEGAGGAEPEVIAKAKKEEDEDSK